MRGSNPTEIVYVGNDVTDIGCMRFAGYGVAVADALPDVLADADLVVTSGGGRGAVREICDRILARADRENETGE